jgi:hypothetical protein
MTKKREEIRGDTLWGVIRYIWTSGAGIHEEPTAFCGWWSDIKHAETFYKSWRREYPNWSVALVQTDRLSNVDQCLQMTPEQSRLWLSVMRGLSARQPRAYSARHDDN